MDEANALSADTAQTMLGKSTPLSSNEVLSLLRFLKRSNDDLTNKIRQLKNDIGRVAHR